MAEVVAPLVWSEFESVNWLRSFRHLSGAPERFRELMPWEHLDRLLAADLPSRDAARLVHRGARVPTSEYLEATTIDAETSPRYRISPGPFVRQMSMGATLIVDHIDRLCEGPRELANTLELELRSPTNVNLYANFGPDHGFDVHYDAQELFILQVHGRKHWDVYEPTRTHPLPGEHAPSPEAPPYWSGTLDQGDVLYIPRGWWHLARGLKEPSLHLTVTVTPPSGLDLLQHLVDECRDDAAVRADLRWNGDVVTHLSERFGFAFSGEAVGRFRKKWESQLRSRQTLHLPATVTDQHSGVTSGSWVQLVAPEEPSIIPLLDTQMVELHIAGSRIECDPDVASSLLHLSGAQPISTNELMAALPRRDAERESKLLLVLNALSMRGDLWVVHPGSA